MDRSPREWMLFLLMYVFLHIYMGIFRVFTTLFGGDRMVDKAGNQEGERGRERERVK